MPDPLPLPPPAPPVAPSAAKPAAKPAPPVFVFTTDVRYNGKVYRKGESYDLTPAVAKTLSVFLKPT